MKKPTYLDASADISEDGVYRYWLSRRISMGERVVLFVGLNPSTADASLDDPTIRRCVGFARTWGFDWLYMGNLNAWRATNPKELPDEPLTAVGPMNQEALKWLTQRADLIIAAWGGNALNSYAVQLARTILQHPRTRCLGQNGDGTPRHPLYLPKTLQPEYLRTGPPPAEAACCCRDHIPAVGRCLECPTHGIRPPAEGAPE